VKERTYKLDELARAAGTSPRTIRYYVQRGLLPAATFHGKDTSYGQEHLVRLRAIKRLQEAYLPLDAIATELEGKDGAGLERLAEGKHLPKLEVSPPPAPPSRKARDAKRKTPASRTWRVIELAPGIELSVADDVESRSRGLVEKVIEVLEEAGMTPEGDER
jgi:DNA-binding transcriptional MerR regulator